ncbi:tetratricopeptide repeat protein, partial [uncultured Helicobacter sp.]
MSLQSNLKSVKESFNSDEKLLESAFALEIMWKRYRKYIITLLICMVGVGIWWLVSNYIQSQKAIKASAAYERLISDSTDKEALESLKDASPALYDMYRYFNANNDSAV